MPHYKNGRLAQENDLVLGYDWNKKLRVGVISNILQGDTCNATLYIIAPGRTDQFCISLKDCFHAEDAFAAIASQQAMLEALQKVMAERGAAPDAPIQSIGIKDAAGLLYEAYNSAVGGKTWNGDTLPDWQTFTQDQAKQKQVAAWVEVAKTALSELAIMPAPDPEDREYLDPVQPPAQPYPTDPPTADTPVSLIAVETKTYSDGTVVTGPGPLPDASPAQQDAVVVAAGVEPSKDRAA
jgi:hypothetical protein